VSTYTIRSFDAISGMIQVDYPTGPTVTLFLPIDAEHRVPQGEELDQYIINSMPSNPPPPSPVENADAISSLVQPFAPIPFHGLSSLEHKSQ
jgi:hypothetical protein